MYQFPKFGDLMTVLKDIQKECRIQTQNDSCQPLCAPKKWPPKMINSEYFLQFSNLHINKTHFSQNKYYSAILAAPSNTPSWNRCFQISSGWDTEKCTLSHVLILVNHGIVKNGKTLISWKEDNFSMKWKRF